MGATYRSSDKSDAYFTAFTFPTTTTFRWHSGITWGTMAIAAASQETKYEFLPLLSS